MTAKWRVIDEKGTYAPRDPTPVLLALGDTMASALVYKIKAPAFEVIPFGDTFESDTIVGPHLEPLNDEAREKIAAYWFANPNATLDPTRRMPLGQDPMGGRSIEQSVQALLEAMERDAVAAAPVAQEDSASLLRTLAEGQAAMLQVLTAVLARDASPPLQAKGRAS